MQVADSEHSGTWRMAGAKAQRDTTAERAPSLSDAGAMNAEAVARHMAATRRNLRAAIGMAGCWARGRGERGKEAGKRGGHFKKTRLPFSGNGLRFLV